MKIENIDIEQFLKNDKLVLNKNNSIVIGKQELKRKPSIVKRHVKKPTRVKQALNDLNENHNWSWYDEVKSRYSDSMDKPMTFYRGSELTGNEVFELADKLATSFDFNGIKKGDEIMLCMANVPEYLVVLLAASKCGAKVKPIGEDFDKKFIKELVDKNPKKLFIGTDDKYEKILPIIKNAGFKHKLIVSLTDSLKDGIDPYYYYDNKFYEFKNKLGKIKEKDSDIISFSDYVSLGYNHKATFPKVSIDDEFTVTFTSGSTKVGWPKAIIHTNRHYISIGRFHDSDLSRMPAMRNMRGLAHIPTHSNTDMASSISDVISQKCTIAFEPIYDENFFAYSLLINQVGFAPATRSFWIKAMKEFKTNPDLIGKTLPHAINYVVVGEDSSKNEIIFIDKGLKKLKAGSEELPKPLSPITISVGGGNCEHGGLFFTLFKSLREKISLRKNIRDNYGLTPFQLSDIAVLHEDGTECDYEEIGNLVANSPCTMKEYENNEEATNKFYKTDSYGRVWGNCNVWAYIAKNGNVVMKGRKDSIVHLSSGKIIPNFLIAENILSDRKNILSCEVVTVKDDNDNDIAVAHIEMEPDSTKSERGILTEIENRNRESFSEELSARVVYRFRSNSESFPLTKSGKRSIRALEEEGLNNCIKPVSTCDYNDNATPNDYTVVHADFAIKNSQYLFNKMQKPIQKVRK